MAIVLNINCCPCDTFEGPCDSCCLGTPSGDVLVSITKAQYLAYIAGGTWAVSYSFTQGESYDDPTAGTGTANGTMTGTHDNDGSGCSQSAPGSGTGVIHFVRTPTDGDPSESDSTNTNSCTISINIGSSGGTYQMAITISDIVFKSGSGSDTGYGTGTATVDGHSVPLISTWTPGWTLYAGYSNSSSLSLSASFTPDAP